MSTINSRPPSTTRLESIIGMVLRSGVTLSAVALAAGLLLRFSRTDPAISGVLLQIGILVLLATPVFRVAISIVEYFVNRDWMFVTLTTIVLLELGASIVAALVFNRRL